MNKGLWFSVIILVALTGCSRNSSDPELVFFKSKGAPDELTLVVYEPIEKPGTVETLPPPGTTKNIAVPEPKEDVLLLLGSSGQENIDGNISQQYDDLILYTQRMGTGPDIRGVLAQEDFEFRKRNSARPLEKWANVNVYFAAYDFMSLDSRAEYQRMRSEGVIP